MKRALAILFMAGAASAGDQCVRNCTIVPMTPPSEFVQCLIREHALVLQVRRYREEAATLREDVAVLQQELAAARAPKVARASRLPCKKGRTRNKLGVCGRW